MWPSVNDPRGGILSSLATSSMPWRLQPHPPTPGPAEQPDAPSGGCIRNVAEVRGAQAPSGALYTRVRDSRQMCLEGAIMLVPQNPATHPHTRSERLGRRLSSTQHKALTRYRNPGGQDSWSKGLLDSAGMPSCPHPIPSWNSISTNVSTIRPAGGPFFTELNTGPRRKKTNGPL